MQPNFTFKYGRKDCATSPLTDTVRPLPGGHIGEYELFKFFYAQFHMTTEETVCIMGGHTLGGSTGFSGWRGFWSGSPDQGNRFNNEYYRLLADNSLDWKQLVETEDFPTDPPTDRWQWNATRNGKDAAFMLNADMAIFKRLQLSNQPGPQNPM